MPTAPRPARDLYLSARLVHRALRYRYKLNPGQIRAMRGLLPRGGFGLDVGAHKGAYACWMARCVGPGGRVLAFEPQDRLAGRTAESLCALRLRQVRLIHAAVSDRCGRADLAIRRGSTHGASLHGETLSGQGIDRHDVEMITLDAAVAADGPAARRRVGFIKIDVEGHELAVLRGAMGILERSRPAVLVEVEARHHSGASPLDAVAGLLASMGYRGEFFTARGRRPITEFDASAHQQYGSGARGEYCNDFLFTAPAPA